MCPEINRSESMEIWIKRQWHLMTKILWEAYNLFVYCKFVITCVKTLLWNSQSLKSYFMLLICLFWKIILICNLLQFAFSIYNICAFSTQNHLYGKKYILSWIMLIFLYNSFYFILFKYMHWIHNIFNISIALLLSLKYINWVWDFKSWSSKKDTFLHLSNFPFYLFFSLPKLEWSVTL